MAEILYRSDEHRFSVYRLRDIPPEVPRSGWVHSSRAVEHFAWRASQISDGSYSRSYFEDLSHFTIDGDACCAVLDEHAGPLLAPRFTVGMRVVSEAYGRGEVASIAALDRGIIGVLRDGDDQPGGYHPSVWTPEPAVAFSVGQRVRLSERGRSIYRALWTGVVTAVMADRVEVQRDGERHPLPYAPAIWEPEPAPAPVLHAHPVVLAYCAGAKGGEHRIDYRTADPVPIRAASAAWSRTLRVLVRRSDEERKRSEDARVGWDPYGDEP